MQVNADDRHHQHGTEDGKYQAAEPNNNTDLESHGNGQDEQHNTHCLGQADHEVTDRVADYVRLPGDFLQFDTNRQFSVYLMQALIYGSPDRHHIDPGDRRSRQCNGGPAIHAHDGGGWILVAYRYCRYIA